MGKRTSYARGTFSWVDLGTPDVAAAMPFYAGVFGWEFETESGDGPRYTICRLDADAVCGLYEGPGTSSNWTNYVTVEDAEMVATRAREVGGHVVEEPFDVLDAGRTAVLRDPQGAVFAVWQPRGRIGAERVNDVGCLCMNELVTTDVEAAASFYQRLFGWTTEISAAAGGFSMIFNRGNINAAVFAAPAGTQAHWRPCFTVEDAEAAVRRVEELGGEQLLAPVEIGHGSLAMVRDPQDAVFTVFAGETHP